ncbi:FmdB family zinc ribbon protein [Rhodococcus sp. 3Y1]
MPLYEFRCTGCGPLRAVVRDGRSAPVDYLPQCSLESKRVVSSPRLSHASSAAMGLLDSTARSAHEPAVVSGSLPGRGRQSPPTTSNPLHRKLTSPLSVFTARPRRESRSDTKVLPPRVFRFFENEECICLNCCFHSIPPRNSPTRQSSATIGGTRTSQRR